MSRKAKSKSNVDYARGNDVLLHIKTLSLPAGQTNANRFWWQDDSARRIAAESLGKMRDLRAVEPLIKALDDPDRTLRRKAVWALGAIGDRRAIPALIPLLADVGYSRKASSLMRQIATRTVRPNGMVVDPAVQQLLADLGKTPVPKAIRKSGEGKLVTCFYKALLEDPMPLSDYFPTYRGSIIRALIKALNPLPDVFLVNAALALADLGAIEALPELRSAALLLPFGDIEQRQSWQQAIRQLESYASLPRSAEEAVEGEMDTLPRVPDEASDSTKSLPRATDGDLKGAS